MRRFALITLLALAAAASAADGMTADFFAGAELKYRNIYYNGRIYDVLLRLTPGVKWRMGDHWTVAAQAYIPVVNQYGSGYAKARLNIADVSKELYMGAHCLKATAGLFGNERYGVDVKWAWPLKPWALLEAQAGLTGICSMSDGWYCSTMTRPTFTAGARFYAPKHDTEFAIRGGRYIYEDWGAEGEIMRHFCHCTIGVWGHYSSLGAENGGFKVVMMIPPYARRHRKVNVRPASNFRLTYNIMADIYSMQTYTTDPEENEREGHFDRERLQWGSNTMEPDFREKGGKQ